MRWLLVLFGLSVGAATLVPLYWSVDRSSEIRTYDVQRVTLLQRRVLSGVVVPKRRAQVFAGVSGRVERVFVNRDDMVRRGQPLLQIENARLLLETRRRRVALGRAQFAVAQCDLPAAADAKPSGNNGKDCEADRLGL
jgi:multidrug efflux pump subunit AcrA (membrane-fusion protein)